MRLPLALALLSPLALPLAPARAQNPTALITVDARQVLGPVNRRVLGHNIEAANGKGIFGPSDSLGSMRAGDGFWNPDTKAPVPQALAFTRELGPSVLRYPGGCLAHGFDWKQTVGAVESRPQWAFGLDEYLKLCAAANSEPLITVADYTGTPQDAADLVEYLNAPATAQFPWAMKRAANGRRAPWAVKYFEMGNESDHGNHELKPSQKWTATQYAAWFNECAAKMRAVDPTIQLGALMGTGTGPGDEWNDTVLAGTKGRADFIIVHTYPIGIWAPAAPVGGFDAPKVTIPPVADVMRATMAATEVTEAMLAQYRAKIRAIAGRDLPLAITEFNAGLVQEEPQPMRFAFGPALFSADYQRALLKPGSNVLMANYWHLLNGYWGALQGPRLPQDKAPWKRYPAFFLFRLWGQHFGDSLVAAEVRSPRQKFAGLPSYAPPADADAYRPESIDSRELFAEQGPAPITDENVTLQVLPGHVWRVDARPFAGEKHLPLGRVRAPGKSYVLRFEARSGGDWKSARLGLGMIDERGWAATRSGIAVEGAEAAREWTKFEGRFRTLEGSPGADLMWRLRAGVEPAGGFLEVRNVQVFALTTERFAAHPIVTGTASKSRDNKKLFVVLFNKGESPIATTVQLKNFRARAARRWVVSGPSLAADNRKAEEVRETESGVATPLANGAVRWSLPPLSMTALEIE